jgi:hypothetical protein
MGIAKTIHAMVKYLVPVILLPSDKVRIVLHVRVPLVSSEAPLSSHPW